MEHHAPTPGPPPPGVPVNGATTQPCGTCGGAPWDPQHAPHPRATYRVVNRWAIRWTVGEHVVCHGDDFADGTWPDEIASSA